jgi:hypothetical protein
MTYAETVKTVDALSVGDLVRVVAARTGFVRVYDPTLGVPAAVKNSANLPAVATVTLHQASDDAAPWYGAGHTGGSNGPYTGTVDVTLTVPAADVVNAASIQTFKVEGQAVVVVATGTN